MHIDQPETVYGIAPSGGGDVETLNVCFDDCINRYSFIYGINGYFGNMQEWAVTDINDAIMVAKGNSDYPYGTYLNPILDRDCDFVVVEIKTEYRIIEV